MNVNGFKGFCEVMIVEDYQKCLDIVKDQICDGVYLLDLCVDYVGCDGVVDMKVLVSWLVMFLMLLIMLDFIEIVVLQVGLEYLGGWCVINLVNYEDGDGLELCFVKIMVLVVEYGVVVVVLIIDEEGQVCIVQKKVEIVEWLINDIIGNWGVDELFIFIDILMFIIVIGQEEFCCDGIEIIEVICELKKCYLDVQIIFGLFNILFGFNFVVCQVFNLVFLYEC